MSEFLTLLIICFACTTGGILAGYKIGMYRGIKMCEDLCEAAAKHGTLPAYDASGNWGPR